MTMERKVRPENKIVTTVLPWVVAAGALIVYLLTLNPWVSFSNLAQVIKASGWGWQPDIFGPLSWLVTYPIHWLPARAIPLGLNLFSAVCAALTLGLLARSVALLPQDRTEAQRARKRSEFSLLSVRTAWLPPVLAAMVCGLQLTFWERATSASGGNTPLPSNQMLDLLLFAYIIRCLLEFRIDERESWLTRAALVCGLGMTNDWAMIGFFPIFLAALVWTKGVGFFSVRFLTRMFLWGSAGLSLYLLLPLVQSLADISQVPFWSALKANLVFQKMVLTTLPFSKAAVFTGDSPLWILGLFSLLPLLVMSIRWPSYFGDPSKLGVTLATLIFHFFHGVLLIVCFWVALDPRFSPRHHALLSAYGIPGLTLYYLAALGIGYFSGYFLLVFGAKPLPPRPEPAYLQPINAVVTALIWVLLVLAPATLLYRNLSQIRITNGPMLKRFASSLSQSLPAKATVVLSDDPVRLALVESLAVQSGRDYLFLDAGSLRWPEYHRFLKKKYPQSWQSDPAKNDKQPVDDLAIVGLVYNLATNHALYYLHPSFGYYFEVFYPEAHGQVYRLEHYGTNAVFAPQLSKELIDENEAYWAKTDEDLLKPVLAAITPAKPGRNPGMMAWFMEMAHLTKEPNHDAAILGAYSSRALDFWGVQMQRNGHLPQAAAHFSRALDLNADNIVAEVNFACNRQLQAGNKLVAQVPKAMEDQFGKYRNWEQILTFNGPFDDPNFCYPQGLVFAGGHNYRQALHEFARVKALSPDNFAARLWLAELYLLSNRADLTVREVEEIHAQPALSGADRTNQIELASVEASAYLARNDVPRAETAVEAALRQFPNDEDLMGRITQTYMNHGRYSNALAIIERQLKIAPDNPNVLVNKGFSFLQIGAYEQAIPPLDRALSLQTNNYLAMFDRAIANFKSGKLEAAQQDCETIQKAYPTFFKTYYILGEIAFNRKETNAATRSYQLYLTNAPPNTDEAKYVSARLGELQHPGWTNHPAPAQKP
jgi:tetratricopeptide (TPR) repeat protein